MEKSARYFTIGIFVSLSLLAMTVFIIWLAGTHDQQKFERYTIYFNDPVSGLKDGAIVQYRGVEVGRVLDVRISKESSELIKADIEVEEDTPMNASSAASLAPQGLTGLAYIDLTTEKDNSAAPQFKPNERYPVIPGKGTQLSKVFQDIPAITSQILELTERLNKTFGEDSTQSLAETLKNVETISQNINMLLSEQNIGYAGSTLRNLSESSASINELVERFRKTADEIDEAAKSVNAIVGNNQKNIENFTSNGLNQITEMSSETKEMAQAIRRLADSLEQEPSRILFKPEANGVEIAQ